MLPFTLIVVLFCLTNPLEAIPTVKSSVFTTLNTTTRPSIVKSTPNISDFYNDNPENEFALIKDNHHGKLNLVEDKRTPVNNQLHLQQQTGKVNYLQSKDATNQVNSLRSATHFTISGNTNQQQQQGLGHLHVLGLQGGFQDQLLPFPFLSKSQLQSAKYREVEEISPTNEVDQESREPEISRQPEMPRGGGGGPVIPPHEPESAPIDPRTPGYAGPPQSAVPSPGQPSFPAPPSPGFPGGVPSTPNSHPQTPSFPPNLFPPQQPGVVVSSLPPTTTTESDTESRPPQQQPPPVSPHYPPATIIPNASPLYPNTFHLSPPQHPQPPSIQFPLPVASPLPPYPPPSPVYPSYSPPSWLTNFYTPSTNFYSNFPYNEGLVSTYPTHLSPTLKSSYLIPRSLISVGSAQLTAVGPYLASSVSNLATHTHFNPLYLNHGDHTTHLSPDNNQEPQLINVNPSSPPIKGAETTESSTTTTVRMSTTEPPVEGFKESDEVDDVERISNI